MRLLILVSLLTIPAVVLAADRGFYAGGGWSSVDASYARDDRFATFAENAGLPEGSLPTRDLQPLGANAWRAMAGYRFLDWLAVEGAYARFAGNSANTGIVCVTLPCPQREVSDADSTSLSVLALYPRGPFDLFVKAGASHWSGDVEFRNPDGSSFATSSTSGTDLGYGAGVQLRASRVVTRLEVERVKFGDDEASLFTLGVACTF
jgi:hypothetical protein